MVVIVVSGKPGSGSSTNAKLLAKKLKLKHFSVGDYYKKHVANSKSHSVKSLITPMGTDKNTHEDIDRMQIDVAAKGNVVVEGKTSIHFIPKADFKIWLKADTTVVAERMARQEKMTSGQAKKQIEERMANERQMFKKIYGFDTFSQEKKADLVVNTSKMTPEEITDFIISKMIKRHLI